MVDETLEAFFLLPILLHQVLLPELTSGLDKCIQHYVSKAKSSCGMQILGDYLVFGMMNHMLLC